MCILICFYLCPYGWYKKNENSDIASMSEFRLLLYSYEPLF